MRSAILAGAVFTLLSLLTAAWIMDDLSAASELSRQVAISHTKSSRAAMSTGDELSLRREHDR
jgi:hypothetical protein